MAEKKEKPETTVRRIRRKTRKKYSAEDKIRIVIEGLHGDMSVAELCRKEGISQTWPILRPDYLPHRIRRRRYCKLYPLISAETLTDMWLLTTTGETWGLKETIPTSLSDTGQFLQLASLIEAKHF